MCFRVIHPFNYCKIVPGFCLNFEPSLNPAKYKGRNPIIIKKSRDNVWTFDF